MRLAAITTGVLLLLTAVWCFANIGAVFLVMAFVIGMAMIVFGVVGCLVFIKSDMPVKEDKRSCFEESIITAILGIFILANLMSIDVVVPFVFGMWLLTSGINRALDFKFKKTREVYDYWGLGIGAFAIIFGVYCFSNTIALDLPVVLLVGVSCLIQGANRVAFGVAMPPKKWIKRNTKNN